MVSLIRAIFVSALAMLSSVSPSIAPPPQELFGYLMVSLISFILGGIVGWGLSTKVNELDEGSIRRIIAIVLLMVYIISVLSEIWLARYQTPVLLPSDVGGTIGFLISQDYVAIIIIRALNSA